MIFWLYDRQTTTAPVPQSQPGCQVVRRGDIPLMAALYAPTNHKEFVLHV